MNTGSDRGTMPDGTQLKRWDDERTVYRCADGVDLSVSNRALRRSDGKVRAQTTCVNTIVYKISTKGKKVRLFISGLEFNRDVSRVLQGAMNIKTATFPNTIRKVTDGAFIATSVVSMVLNEGLETFGGRKDKVKGVFRQTTLKQIMFPSTLKKIEYCTFQDYFELRHVQFHERSRLERIEERVFYGCENLKVVNLPEGLKCIGSHCFSRSGLEEITIPSSVTVLEEEAFAYCR